MRRLAALGLALIHGCSDQIPERIELGTGGAKVEIIYEAPSADAYKMVGEVSGIAAGADFDSARAAALNELRNKAGALGATLVVVDENLGEPVLLLRKTKVTLVGRAFKAAD